MPLAPETFIHLFRGRGDAYGTWHGGAVRERLTPERFVNHLHSPDPADWFGVYNVIGTRCSWGCVDIDVRDLPLARNVQLSLARRNIPGWIEQTTRGYHVWVFPADHLVDATVMRLALTAACRAVDYSPKEVFPKQTRTSADGLGNYVRLPLNGALAAPRLSETRRFLGDPELELMDSERARTTDLEAVAATLPRPQAVDISVDFKAGVEFASTAQEIGGLVYKIWRDGPGPDHDRSTTLTELAHRLREADVDPEVAYSIVASADDRWGKGFLDRGASGHEIMRKIIANAYGRTLSRADSPVAS